MTLVCVPTSKLNRPTLSFTTELPSLMPASAPTSRIPSPSPSTFSILNPTTLTANSITSPFALHTSTPPSASPSPESHSPILVASDAPNEELGSPLDVCNLLNEVDAQILEALRSKDRLYVLKLGETMESMINEQRPRVELTPASSYQRLLVHRCSAYYKLAPESDGPKAIVLLPTPESRIPPRRLCELVPAEPTAQPAFKIMRRNQDRARSKAHSQAGSVAGDDADLSDVEPSESGSLGGRSSATGGSSGKKRMTIEEREAAYNEARLRIFMGFEEKDKGKDISASSSTLSLVSGSASTSGGGEGSSVDDIDDSVSTPATESEWSAPITIAVDKKEARRNGGSGNNSSGSSSRSLRSSALPFNTNGASSSRNSRTSSPAFQYASLYEPPTASASPYEMSQAPQMPVANYHAWGYPFPPQTQGPVPYISNYQHQYGGTYSWPHPQQSVTLPSPDPSNPTDVFSPSPHTPPQSVPYANPYAWTPPHPPIPTSIQHSQPNSQQQPPHHPNLSPTQNGAPYPTQYMPPYTYPMPGYFQPQSPIQQGPLPPHIGGQPVFAGEAPRPVNGNGVMSGNRNVNGNSPNHSRASSRSSAGAGGGKRGGPPARTAWSYGPGVSMGGINNNSVHIGGDVVGPRLSSSMRRTSGASSVGSGSTGNRTPGDEASSSASSSTNSSSSRRTFTSTTSSQHPLPPRPDWAVGLKPQPTLHSTHNRHHDHSLHHSQTGSPARNGVQSQSSTVLQVTDFPPLTSLSSVPERRTPAVTGAWTNSSSMRSILMPIPGHATTMGSALVHHPGAGIGDTDSTRLEEQSDFERPPPKGAVELFNPNVSRRPASNGKASPQTQERPRADLLATHMVSMSLVDVDGSHNAKEAPALSLSA